MDVVLILFQKKLLPITVDPEKNFIMTSWQESLKVFLFKIIKGIFYKLNNLIKIVTQYFFFFR